METLFSLLSCHAQYVVDGKDFGQASLRRTRSLAEWLNAVSKGIRTFNARNTPLAGSTPFKLPFVIVFSVPARIWKEMA